MEANIGVWRKTERYVVTFFHYFSQYMKTQMSYRADFFANVFSELFQQSVNLIFIAVVFTRVPELKGWTREEILFIYGFFLVPFGIYGGFFNHLFDVPEKYVLEGEFDRILIRPLNSWFQVILETMKPGLLVGCLTGFALMYYSASSIGLVFHWWDIPVFIGLVFGASLVYAGVYTLLASLGFWSEGNIGLMPMVYNLSNYGRYPMTIYRGLTRFLLTWVLPFAFVGFYPATFIMHRFEFMNYAMMTPLVGIISFAAGYRVWNAGVKRYRGTGS